MARKWNKKKSRWNCLCSVLHTYSNNGCRKFHTILCYIMRNYLHTSAPLQIDKIKIKMKKKKKKRIPLAIYYNAVPHISMLAKCTASIELHCELNIFIFTLIYYINPSFALKRFAIILSIRLYWCIATFSDFFYRFMHTLQSTHMCTQYVTLHKINTLNIFEVFRTSKAYMCNCGQISFHLLIEIKGFHPRICAT